MHVFVCARTSERLYLHNVFFSGGAFVSSHDLLTTSGILQPLVANCNTFKEVSTKTEINVFQTNSAKKTTIDCD